MKFDRVNNQTAGMWVFEEPFFCIVFLRTQALQSDSMRASLRGAGCTKLGHLMRLIAFPVNVLREKSKITSIQLINRVVTEAMPPLLRLFARDQTLAANTGSPLCLFLL